MTWTRAERPSPPRRGLCQLSLLWGLRDQGGLGPPTHSPSPCAFQEKKQRRAENLRRRLENERKAEIVQVVSVAPPGGLGVSSGVPGTRSPAAVPGLPFPGTLATPTPPSHPPDPQPRQAEAGEEEAAALHREAGHAGPAAEAAAPAAGRRGLSSGQQEASCGQPRHLEGHWTRRWTRHSNSDSKTGTPAQVGL